MSRFNANFEHITGTSSGGQFADPFMSPSNEGMPDTLSTDTFDFCTYLFYLNEVYNQAAGRRIAHFITDVEFVGEAGDTDEQTALKDFLADKLKIFDFMLEYGLEWSCYGNAFAWLYRPFDRVLVDERDGGMTFHALGIFPDDSVKFNLKEMTYEVPDPRLIAQQGMGAPKISLPFRDRPARDAARLALRKLDPRNVVIKHSEVSGTSQYIWQFPLELVRRVESNVLFEINQMPQTMLRAMRDKQDYLFGAGQVFHMKAPTVSGVSDNGWGLPDVIKNYRSLHMVQIYRKIDEAIGLDYMLPFRIFTPNVSPDKVGDSILAGNMHVWQRHIQEMIKARRKNPFAMHAMPMPVSLTEMGSNGKSLTPKDIHQMQTDQMLDAMGFPAELFHGALALNQSPMALRLFEGHHRYLYGGLNRLLRWAVKLSLDFMKLEQIGVRLMRPTLADDIEKRSILMQLAAGGEAPRALAYKSVGIENPVEAIKQRALEDVNADRERQKIQKDYERESTMGSLSDQMQNENSGQAAGGATPLNVMEEAQQKATELLQIPVGERARALDQIRASNPQLHALVKQKMEEIRAAGESQGRAQAGQMAAQA